jgi:ATP-binding cassette, subfamily B, bacterial CvaB/MchF/RaxB
MQTVFGARARLPMIQQSEASECGLACLAMIASYHGRQVDLTGLRHRFAVSLKGMTMRSLLEMAQGLDLCGRGLRLEPEALATLRTPAVLHWDMNHFVTLKSARGGGVVIHDPAFGVRTLTIEEVGRHFTGVALELTPTPGFRKGDEVRRLKLSELCGRIDGLGGAAGQALVLSVVLQVFVLASPFYMQIAVDEGVLQGDHGLLIALAVGFGLLTLIKLAADALRARVLLALSAVVSVQMVANLFHHMLRLPLDWFEKRHIGDMVSRFGATRPITDLISQGLVAAVVDGVMALFTVVALFVYSPLLAAIVIGALGLHLTLRLVSFHLLRERELAAIEAMAREQTCFIETAGAMQAIKLFGAESERESLWLGRTAAAINRRSDLAGLHLILRIANDAIYGIENLLVVYVGARLAIDSRLTVGMLFAFVSYKQQFLEKATRLLETAIRVRMLDLHLSRIADIALAAPEPGLDRGALFAEPLTGDLELRDVSFRYADAEPDILAGVDLRIEAGQMVAITGASGGGKTTLLKVMLGLLPPSRGEVLVDGRRMDDVGVAGFRAQVGAVMQDDALLSGSIAENITFFDAQPDLQHMRDCARLAGVDPEIMAMPMNYNTLVGALGTGLSGGQRQRLFLARALYRRPRILFMDEGTSHLDIAKEREVNAALARLNITRVIIAHRPETIAAADRVVEFRSGRVIADSAAVPAVVAA